MISYLQHYHLPLTQGLGTFQRRQTTCKNGMETTSFHCIAAHAAFQWQLQIGLFVFAQSMVGQRPQQVQVCLPFCDTALSWELCCKDEITLTGKTKRNSGIDYAISQVLETLWATVEMVVRSSLWKQWKLDTPGFRAKESVETLIASSGSFWAIWILMVQHAFTRTKELFIALP